MNFWDVLNNVTSHGSTFKFELFIREYYCCLDSHIKKNYCLFYLKKIVNNDILRQVKGRILKAVFFFRWVFL